MSWCGPSARWTDCEPICPGAGRRFPTSLSEVMTSRVPCLANSSALQLPVLSLCLGTQINLILEVFRSGWERPGITRPLLFVPLAIPASWLTLGYQCRYLPSKSAKHWCLANGHLRLKDAAEIRQSDHKILWEFLTAEKSSNSPVQLRSVREDVYWTSTSETGIRPLEGCAWRRIRLGPASEYLISKYVCVNLRVLNFSFSLCHILIIYNFFAYLLDKKSLA